MVKIDPRATYLFTKYGTIISFFVSSTYFNSQNDGGHLTKAQDDVLLGGFGMTSTFSINTSKHVTSQLLGSIKSTLLAKLPKFQAPF